MPRFHLSSPDHHLFFPAIIRKLQPERESVRGLLKAVVRQHPGKYRIHLLLDEAETLYGLIAVSVQTLDGDPHLIVELLVTATAFRGQRFTELGGTTVSRYLMDYAGQLARDVGLRDLALMPLSQEPALIRFYEALDYSPPDKEGWMYLRLP